MCACEAGAAAAAAPAAAADAASSAFLPLLSRAAVIQLLLPLEIPAASRLQSQAAQRRRIALPRPLPRVPAGRLFCFHRLHPLHKTSS